MPINFKTKMDNIMKDTLCYQNSLKKKQETLIALVFTVIEFII